MNLRFDHDTAARPARRSFGKRSDGQRAAPDVRRTRDSWEPVAKQYGKSLSEEDSFQSEVIFPRALHLLDPKKGKNYLDIACGEGAFVRAVAKIGAKAVGFDLAASLIKLAEQKKTPGATFRVGNATDFARYYQEAEFDGASCNLALQNIEDFGAVLNDAGKVLKSGSPLVIVLNHPMFRIPRQSGWGWDDKRSLQYRRVDAYMTPNEIPIVANPGRGERSAITYSYHRPLSAYVKALAQAGFAIDALEEWVSHHTSDSGPRAKAENRARAEIPMFMAVRAVKR